MRATFAPCSAARREAATPPEPAPRVIRSKSSAIATPLPWSIDCQSCARCYHLRAPHNGAVSDRDAPRPFRLAGLADVPALAALYVNCAATFGPAVYTPEQVAAWRSFGEDRAAFHAYILGADTWVADDTAGGAPIGFCGISRAGEVHSLYVHPAAARRGLGLQLLRWALEQARERGVRSFAAWATPFSKPVFERAGFRLDRVSREPYNGVLFDRYHMVLGEGGPRR